MGDSTTKDIWNPSTGIVGLGAGWDRISCLGNFGNQNSVA